MTTFGYIGGTQINGLWPNFSSFELGSKELKYNVIVLADYFEAIIAAHI